MNNARFCIVEYFLLIRSLFAGPLREEMKTRFSKNKKSMVSEHLIKERVFEL